MFCRKQTFFKASVSFGLCVSLRMKRGCHFVCILDTGRWTFYKDHCTRVSKISLSAEGPGLVRS